MSSYDKVVKLACKPKAAPPKAKYLDPIIAATWSDDGAVHDVCKALSPRFREPNSIVVFKALIVLHTMIRNGATDNVLSYLASSEVLRLRNVSSGNWEGYNPPQNLQHYSVYLDSRIRAYRELKHDAVRVQSESNRDWRNSNSIEEDSSRDRRHTGDKPTTSSLAKTKTTVGRKLGVMSVEKGLLRETKIVQRMIDTLVECRFYLDDLEDGLTTTALRMLVKDLLVLFQAGNEGVINVLEHYFEMSHIDAKDALTIYRQFCKQTERVVEYLGVAKKLQNILNVPIPNLKHAPVSLAGALQEYLDDPNFEQNRIEYKTSKEAKESNANMSENSFESEKASPTQEPIPPVSVTSTFTSHSPDKPQSSHAIVDFLAAIEEEQPAMSNSQTNGPHLQKTPINPFVSLQMMSGEPYISQPMAPGHLLMPTHPTNLLISQQMTFQPQMQPTSSTIWPSQQPSSFLPPQATGIAQSHQLITATLQPQTSIVPLQPQATGLNPFRQSSMFPQATGIDVLNMSGSGVHTSELQRIQGHLPLMASTDNTPTSFGSSTSPLSLSLVPSWDRSTSTIPARPASTPLAWRVSSSQQYPISPPAAQPLKPHLTGSRNPFGPSAQAPPPVPKPPTLMELALGNHADPRSDHLIGTITSGSSDWRESRMASVASSFLSTNKESHVGGDQTKSTEAPPMSPLAPNTPSPLSSSQHPSTLSPTLKPQTTGFAGLKTFQPTSSFGTMLLESLPPVSGSSTAAQSGDGMLRTSSAVVNVTPGFANGVSNASLQLGTTSPTINPFRLSTLTSPTGEVGRLGDLKPQPMSPPVYAGISMGFPPMSTSLSLGTNRLGGAGASPDTPQNQHGQLI